MLRGAASNRRFAFRTQTESDAHPPRRRCRNSIHRANVRNQSRSSLVLGRRKQRASCAASQAESHGAPHCRDTPRVELRRRQFDIRTKARRHIANVDDVLDTERNSAERGFTSALRAASSAARRSTSTHATRRGSSRSMRARTSSINSVGEIACSRNDLRKLAIEPKARASSLCEITRRPSTPRLERRMQASLPADRPATSRESAPMRPARSRA